ncbi:hypothetical protein CDIK_1972 [Cucumispora dikerogammari]|nr:hypothetical protein CDIK_1972 [Cucumispora dikerogammari]
MLPFKYIYSAQFLERETLTHENSLQKHHIQSENNCKPLNSSCNNDENTCPVSSCLTTKGPYRIPRLYINKNTSVRHNIKYNIIPSSLLLCETLLSFNKRYNMFQTKSFPHFNISNVMNNTDIKNTIQSQFIKYIADITSNRKNKVYDISFIRTLMYGFVKYLEYNPNSQHFNTSNINDEKTNTIKSLDPKGLLLDTSYIHINKQTIEYINKFMSQQTRSTEETKFSLYLNEVIEVLDRIQKKIDDTNTTETSHKPNTSKEDNEQLNCQIYDTSSCIYNKVFRQSVQDIIDSIRDINIKNEKSQLTRNLLEIDVIVLTEPFMNKSESKCLKPDLCFYPQFIIGKNETKAKVTKQSNKNLKATPMLRSRIFKREETTDLPKTTDLSHEEKLLIETPLERPISPTPSKSFESKTPTSRAETPEQRSSLLPTEHLDHTELSHPLSDSEQKKRLPASENIDHTNNKSLLSSSAFRSLLSPHKVLNQPGYLYLLKQLEEPTHSFTSKQPKTLLTTESDEDPNSSTHTEHYKQENPFTQPRDTNLSNGLSANDVFNSKKSESQLSGLYRPVDSVNTNGLVGPKELSREEESLSSKDASFPRDITEPAALSQEDYLSASEQINHKQPSEILLSSDSLGPVTNISHSREPHTTGTSILSNDLPQIEKTQSSNEQPKIVSPASREELARKANMARLWKIINAKKFLTEASRRENMK